MMELQQRVPSLSVSFKEEPLRGWMQHHHHHNQLLQAENVL